MSRGLAVVTIATGTVDKCAILSYQ